MPGYSLTHLADSKLAQDLRAGTADDRASLAMRLAQIAEFDHRRLYLPAYPSMYRYCLGELKYSEDAACRRLAAARLARRYQEIFSAIANGRHTLSTVLLLEHYLLPESARDFDPGFCGHDQVRCGPLPRRAIPEAGRAYARAADRALGC